MIFWLVKNVLVFPDLTLRILLTLFTLKIGLSVIAGWPRMIDGTVKVLRMNRQRLD